MFSITYFSSEAGRKEYPKCLNNIINNNQWDTDTLYAMRTNTASARYLSLPFASPSLPLYNPSTQNPTPPSVPTKLDFLTVLF